MNPIRLTTELLKATGRNDLCPCRSGLKFKKCCEVLLSWRVWEKGSSSVEGAQIASFVSKSVISNAKPNFHEATKIIEKMPLYFTLRTGCALNYELDFNGGQESYSWQLQFAKDCFKDYWLSKCLYVLTAKQNVVLLADLTALFLIKLVILFADPGKIEPIPQSDFCNFGHLALILNDFIFSLQKDLTDFDLHIIKSSYLKNTAPPKFQFVTGLSIYTELPIQPKYSDTNYPNRIDLENEFREATSGLGLKEYFSLMFGLLSNFINPPPYQPVTRSTFFSAIKGLKADLIEKFWDLISLGSDEYKKTLKAEIGQKPIEQTASDNVTLAKFPFIIHNDHAFCIDANLLNNKFVWGSYWILADHLRKKGGDAALNRFFRFWGDLYEDYIGNIAEGSLPLGCVTRNVRAVSDPQSKPEIDILIELENNLIVIEVTKSIPRTDVMTDPNEQKFKDWLESSILKKCNQLSDSISSLVNEEMSVSSDLRNVGNIFPVVVTPFSLPQNWHMFKKYYRSSIESLLANNQKIRFPIFLSTYGLVELLNIYQKHGKIIFWNIIESKIDNENRFISFHNHLCFNYKKFISTENKYVDDLFDKFSNDIIKDMQVLMGEGGDSNKS